MMTTEFGECMRLLQEGAVTRTGPADMAQPAAKHSHMKQTKQPHKRQTAPRPAEEAAADRAASASAAQHMPALADPGANESAGDTAANTVDGEIVLEEAQEAKPAVEPQAVAKQLQKESHRQKKVLARDSRGAKGSPESLKKEKKKKLANPDHIAEASAGVTEEERPAAADSTPAEASPAAAKTHKKKRLAVPKSSSVEAFPEAALQEAVSPQRRRTRHSGMATLEPLPDPDIMLRAETKILLATASPPAPLPVTPPHAQHSTEAGQTQPGNQSQEKTRRETAQPDAPVNSRPVQRPRRRASGLAQVKTAAPDVVPIPAPKSSQAQKQRAKKSGVARSKHQQAEGDKLVPVDCAAPADPSSSLGRQSQSQTHASPRPKRESSLRRLTHRGSAYESGFLDQRQQLEPQEEAEAAGEDKAGPSQQRRSSRRMAHLHDRSQMSSADAAPHAEMPHAAQNTLVPKRLPRLGQTRTKQQAASDLSEQQTRSPQQQQQQQNVVGKGVLHQQVDTESDPQRLANGKRKRSALVSASVPAITTVLASPSGKLAPGSINNPSDLRDSR